GGTPTDRPQSGRFRRPPAWSELVSAAANRNLLFGILAVQLGFVCRDALIDAMHAWLLDKAKPLGTILCERGHLPAHRLRLLDELVEEHLRGHGGDPRESLAALPPIPPDIREWLDSRGDSDVEFGLARLGTTVPDGGLTVERADSNAPFVPPPATGLRYRVLR